MVLASIFLQNDMNHESNDICKNSNPRATHYSKKRAMILLSNERVK